MRIGNPVFSPNQFGSKRQAITQGRLNSSGLPNSITTASGLSCTINAATAPLVANFAAGFGGQLPIDFTGSFASDQVFSGLTASTTHYFYLERNTSTGVVSAARIAIAPVYARIAPTSPATGLHWFKTSEDSLTTQPGMTMYEWSGSAWVTRQRVFLGEATTSASAVTSIANYAYNRRYQSAWTAAVAGGLNNFNLNLGMTMAEAEATVVFFGRQNSSDLNHTPIPSSDVRPTGFYGYLFFGAATRLNLPIAWGTEGIYYNGAWQTGADVQCSVDSRW